MISSPYSAQYGQAAGAQIAYVTKSGSNRVARQRRLQLERPLPERQPVRSATQWGKPTPFNNFTTSGRLT